MKTFTYILYFLCCAVFFACNDGNIDLDNDSDETFQVTIDALTHNVGPRQHIKLKLEPGPHRITIKNDDDKVTDEETFTVVEGGLINLAKTQYYVWTDLYGDTSLKEEQLKEDWLKIDGKSYFGEFSVVEPESIYLEKHWDYDLDEPFPGDLLGWQFTEEKYIIKKKIFRKQQLIDAYNFLAQDPASN